MPQGTYTSAQSVTISDTTPNATIYYVINGTPTTNSTQYTGAITVSSSETIEAIAVASGYAQSAVATAAYSITPSAATPTTTTLSPSATNLTAGQALTLTATVKAGNTAVTPGQVNFCNATAAYCTDIHLLGMAQLTSSGTATLKFIPAPGSHSYKAVFLGTTADAGSSSNVVSVNVAASGSIATTTTIAQSGVPGNYTLTATVTGQGTISPTGTVSFLDTSNANYVLGTAALTPGSSTATLSFINSSTPATNPYPQSVAVADFNGDGKLDMVVPDYSLPGINILLGNGDGTFLAGPTAPTVAANVNNAVVADFNGDGKTDIALSLPDLNEVQVLLGNGNGTFNALPPISAGTVWQVATGDFNGDGKADLVILNCGAKTLTILLGVGDGTFTPVAPASSVPGCPSAVAVGDFNGDGKTDLAVVIDSSAMNLPGSVTILLGNGDGAFNPTTQNLATGNSPLSIAAGDFNGDGVLDLAIANSYVNTLSTGTVTVLIGKGDGTFTPTVASPVVGSMPYSVAVGDFNGDGKADLVTANVGSNTATILLGNGDGTFTTAATPTAGTGTLFAVVGDFNSDGLSDIAIADNSAGKVTVLLARETGTATVTATVTGISPVGTGTHLVDASYPGDGYYSGSISATTALTAEPVTTTLSLSANPASSTFGQQVLLTATLNPSSAQNHNASGAVTFYSGSTSLGTGTVSNGVATLTTTALPAGNDSITAAYPGDTNFAASNSSALPFTVYSNNTGRWTWMGGHSTLGSSFSSPGVYGTLGTPAAGNIPGGRQYAATWKDSSGRLWLFGGGSINNANGDYEYLNDLWEFNPSTNQWTWISGSSTVNCVLNVCGQPGVYGTLNSPASGNTPGGRQAAVCWIDGNGNLWLFGGFGFAASGAPGYLNDLWEFNPSTVEWTWRGGSSSYSSPGVYGTLNTPAVGNIPGGRQAAASWTDSSGHFWLFGGSISDSNNTGSLSSTGYLNDLWEYYPSTNQWAWMGGSSTIGQQGVSGALGMPATGNIPGSRYCSASWTDGGGNLWLFGGYGLDANGGGYLNDLWEFNPSTNEWAWMGGASIGDQYGVYGTLGTPAVGNIPGSRNSAVNWTDNSGNLWLLEGSGFGTNGTASALYDMWEFSPFTNQWTWMDGSSILNQPGVYGTLGIPAMNNIPGSRMGGAGWTDNSGNFWLLGGLGYDANDTLGELNDLWRYQAASSSQVTATPTFSVPAGSYTSTQYVTISDTTPNAIIYYAINGTPTISSSVYSTPITVSASETLEAIAIATGYSNSQVASATYNIAISTTTALTALPTNLTVGQSLTLTATVTPASGTTPTGTVTFYNGTTSLGSASLNNSGVAQLILTPIVGSYSITASYGGSSTDAPSVSSPAIAVTVNAISTTTALTALPTTLTVGQSLTLTATVTPASGATPTGTVTFYNGTTSLGSASLNNSGVAQLILTPIVGSYSITASYGGSSTDASSVSSPAIAVAVNAIPTTTTLTAVPTSLSYGQTLTLTATVTPASGATPTGTVIFYNGTASLGSGTLNNSGVAQLILTPAVGSYSITASYGGSTNDIASASSSIAVSVNTAATTTTLTASPNPAPFGASVTFTATVANSASGSTITPTGNVSFYDGATLLGMASLNAGAATYSTGSLSVGSHNITATYAGGTGFNSSTSNIVAEVISPADFSISASPASQTVYTGEAASYTVTITPGTGFNLPVALSCSQLPVNTICSFSPATVPGGSTSSTLVVQTSAPIQTTSVFVPVNKLRVPLLTGLLLLFIPRRLRRFRNGWPICLLLLALLITGAFMTGCIAPNPLLGGTPVGTANITITGTATNGSQTLTHTTTVTLNVESLF